MKTFLVSRRFALRAVAISFLGLSCSWPVLGQSFDPAQFETEIERSARDYDDFASQNAVQALMISGDLDEYHRQLTQRVPDREKTFYDYFVLANVLFTEERERSYEYMLNAEALQPRNPYVWYERGIHEHRLGNCDAAIEYYRRLHDDQPRFANPVSWAYRTHCALLIGEYDEAIRAWGNAEFAHLHTSIEKGMYVVFSESRPQTVRQQMLARIGTGEHAAFCELLDHDRNWEVDWWNETTQDRYLASDVALAENVIAAGSPDAKLVRLCLDAPGLSDSEFEAALSSAGFWGENAALPHSGTLIYDMALRLTSGGLAEPEDLLARLERQMLARIGDDSADRKLIEVMGFLYSSTGDLRRLREVDTYGWRRLKLERSAASYLLGTDPSAANYVALLEEAATDFPNSSLIHSLKLQHATDASDRMQSMANYVAAEFANVKENWKGPYRLSDFMAAFERELSASPR